MIDLFIYERGVGLVGEISEYESLQIERSYTEVSKMILRVSKNKENALNLKIGNLLATQNNPNYVYYIDHFSSIVEGKKEVIEIYAFSLNYILSFRTMETQKVFSGNIENVVKSFIDISCINPDNTDRKIENLVLGPNSGISANIRASRTGGDLLSNSFEILKEAEASIDILINGDDFEVITWKGLDRSINQTVNTHVIFSTDYDNVIKQNYFLDRIDYKNVAVVAGEGEGILRKVENVGSSSGWNRREIYVDARDLQSVYQDENGIEQTLTPQEYSETLTNRGLEEISQKNIVESFETTVDDVQYILGVDYFLGDKVTFVDIDLGITKDVIVTKITTTSDKNGVIMSPSFGSGIPNKLIRQER